MPDNISFRAHHFLCALCFQGEGYSPAFVENFSNIMQQLCSPSGDATPITVTANADSICEPCPNRIEKSCKTADKIAVLDSAHARALHIQPGDVLTWGEAKQKITQHITLDTFHKMCETCSWKPLGICEKVVEALPKKVH